MRFSEYLKSIPNVQFEIVRGLNEEIHVDNYHNFIGSPNSNPGESLGNGLFSHGDTFSFNNGQKKVTFKNLDAATEYSEGKRNQFKKSLIDAHTKIASSQDLSSSDSETIKRYTDHLGSLNHNLIRGKELSQTETKTRDNLDSVLAKHTAPDDLVVYSGTNGIHAKTLRSSEVLNHPSFLSTSLSANAARAFASQNGGDIVKIHIPKGHPMVYPNDPKKTTYEGEREVILPRNTKLRIHKDKEQVLIHDSGTYTVHHATIETEK